MVFETTQGLLNFPHLTIQLKLPQIEQLPCPNLFSLMMALRIPPKTTKTITTFVDHSAEWNTTGTVTPLENFTETASPLISCSILTIIDKRVAVRVTNTTE